MIVADHYRNRSVEILGTHPRVLRRFNVEMIRRLIETSRLAPESTIIASAT